MKMNKHLLFVYGTLRREGARSMPVRFPHAQFVAEARVGGILYDLLDPDDPHPGLRLDESGASVTGEVYAVDDKTLAELDELEEFISGRPESSLYIRETACANSCVGERKITCLVYTFNPRRHPNQKLIDSGDWIKYSKEKKD